MKNTEANNELLPSITCNIVQWHRDRNLIDGATDWSQTSKLLEEFVELVAAQMPDESPEMILAETQKMLYNLYVNGRIKTVPLLEAQAAKKDALGDMDVVSLNIMERNSWTREECDASAYDVIKDRKGRMIDGCFVKEEDLPDDDCTEAQTGG